MTETTSDSRLVEDYQDIRQREYTLMTTMLDVLPRIDSLGEERIGQVRDAMFHADHPFLMVFVGAFNAGKTSIINALLGENLLDTGATPTTDRISILRWGDEPQKMNSGGEVDTVFYPSPLLKKVSFVDTPGLESIFQRHEETTRKFLHRSDVVLLVMLATQAMTSRNLETLQLFKEYGKKVIIVINQADLLSAEEREEVQQYVTEQSKDHLGFKPEVWMISAKAGIESRQSELSVSQQKWEESGLSQIENYVNRQLSDANRLRQKLQTPLQIVQNVHQAALVAVKDNQSALDHYQSITENIDQQLAAQRREQQKNIREITESVNVKFNETIKHSGEALREVFQFSRALRSLGNGLLTITGLSRLLRRGDHPSLIQSAFMRHKVFEPINELPTVVDKLAPRLEGQDMQDIDNLVKYGQREMEALPADMREKIIGTIQAPVQYDRSALQDIRADLEKIEDDANTIETQKLEESLKNTLLYLAAWELIVFFLFIAFIGLSGGIEDNGLKFMLLILLASMALIGFLLMPVRGRMLHGEHTNRLLKLQKQYTDTLSEAADKQVEYGIKLRKDTIAPLTRLIEAQTEIQSQQFNQLQATEQQIASIESDLNNLGKRKLLGISI